MFKSMIIVFIPFLIAMPYKFELLMKNDLVIHNEILIGKSNNSNSIQPIILGPTEVNYGSPVTWNASPDNNECACTYTWFMSNSASINHTTDIVGGPSSSDFLDWIVGIEPSDEDFYFQLRITDSTTNNDYFSDVIYIVVN